MKHVGTLWDVKIYEGDVLDLRECGYLRSVDLLRAIVERGGETGRPPESILLTPAQVHALKIELRDKIDGILPPEGGWK